MISERDEALLQAYLDGELSPEESARVELRLANSAEWRRAEQELRELLGDCSQHFAVLDDDDPALQRTPSIAHDEAPATAAAFDAHPDVTPIVAAAARPGRRTPVFALVAAALLVAVGLGTFRSNDAPDRTVAASGPHEPGEPSLTPAQVPAAPAPMAGAADSVAPAPEPDATPSPAPGRPEGTRAPAPPATTPPSPAPRGDAPGLPSVQLAGLAPTASTVDSTFGMHVLRETYEVRPGVVVTLEAVESETMVATRSGRGGAGGRRVDTTTVVQPVDDGLALVWRLPSGVTLRLQGDLPERELRALRERVRVGEQPPR